MIHADSILRMVVSKRVFSKIFAGIYHIRTVHYQHTLAQLSLFMVCKEMESEVINVVRQLGWRAMWKSTELNGIVHTWWSDVIESHFVFL